MRGMVIQNEPDLALGWVIAIEIFEQADELAAAMPPLHSMDIIATPVLGGGGLTGGQHLAT